MKNSLLLFIFLISPFFSLSLSAYESETSFTVVSNYVVRGISQTNDNAAVQLAYDIAFSKEKGFYAGVSSSNVAMGLEVDLYGGYIHKSENGFVYDVGAIEYMYTDTDFKATYHDWYFSAQYDYSYFKIFLGENIEQYWDVGTGFSFLENWSLLFHYGLTRLDILNGDDTSITLQADFDTIRFALSATSENRTPAAESKILFNVLKGF